MMVWKFTSIISGAILRPRFVKDRKVYSAYSLPQGGRFEALVVQFDSEVDVEAKKKTLDV